MFVFIWATLLLCVRGSIAGTSAGPKITCEYNFCIMLNEELTAEAGLCVVIPCSFFTPYGFTPAQASWYKCPITKRRCWDNDRIFHSNSRNSNVQQDFRGRVSLLEPDVSRKNCSIVISDLKESDSGSYQFRVNSHSDRFHFTPKAVISVKALDQKPTVEIPPLKAGLEATLTCTAPGLCSGSVPEIIWMWSGAGGSISGNITALQTEKLNAFANRYSSSLTFNSSAELHGTSVTCRVTFSGGVTTEETETLNVTYLEELKVTGDPSVKEHETLNLTCSLESFPPSRITWMKDYGEIVSNGNVSKANVLQNDTSADLLNDTETSQEKSTRASLFISNVTTGDAGQYICFAEYLNKTLMKEINVTVIYRRDLRMTGDTKVTEGDILNLTCSAESFPPSLIMWTKPGSNTTLQSQSGSASLVIPSVTAEDSGRYVCTVKRLSTVTALYADVAVTYIHRSSRCALQSDVLTCVCVSGGSPLPVITWPLLGNHSEYSVITSVSDRAVNSTVTLTVQTKVNATVECVSGNENGEVKKNLPVEVKLKLSGKDDHSVLEAVWRAETIIAFLIGVLLTAVISCLAILCYRRKQKHSGYLDEPVELVTNNNNDPLLHYAQEVEEHRPYGQEEAANGGAAEEKTTPEADGSKDVEYANIDFSLLKRKNPEDGRRERESTKTEYAEIKRGRIEEREDDDGGESEILEGKGEERGTKEVEETAAFLPEEETAEVEAVYSNVKEVMDDDV